MIKEEFLKKLESLEYIEPNFSCPNCGSNFLLVLEKEPIDKEYFKDKDSEQKCIVECSECKKAFYSIY